MYKKPYADIIKEAPPHDSEQFLTYVRMNSALVYEDDTWLIVENYKYHTKQKPWHTAFLKHDGDIWYMYMSKLLNEYSDWDWLIKGKPRRTVGRFHIHLILKPNEPNKEVPNMQEKEAMVSGTT